MLLKKLATVIALGLAFPRVVESDGGGAATLLDLDQVLGASIDGVADAPEFITPPEGSYVLTVASAKAEKYTATNKDTKEEEERIRIRINYGVVSVKSLKDEAEAPPAAGSMFSEQFMTNPEGLSFFKRQAKNILGEENIKGATIKELLDALGEGHSFAADVKLKVTKGKGDNKGKEFTNVQVRIKPANGAELPAEGAGA